MGKWSPRDPKAKDYGEMGSNPNRKRNGRIRGVKGKKKGRRAQK